MEAWEKERLEKVRKAYWDATPDPSQEVYRLHDVVIETGLLTRPTDEQIKALFMILPNKIFGNGIIWGFSDTEVAVEVYVFIMENQEEVKKAMGVQ